MSENEEGMFDKMMGKAVYFLKLVEMTIQAEQAIEGWMGMCNTQDPTPEGEVVGDDSPICKTCGRRTPLNEFCPRHELCDPCHALLYAEHVKTPEDARLLCTYRLILGLPNAIASADPFDAAINAMSILNADAAFAASKAAAEIRKQEIADGRRMTGDEQESFLGQIIDDISNEINGGDRDTKNQELIDFINNIGSSSPEE